MSRQPFITQNSGSIKKTNLGPMINKFSFPNHNSACPTQWQRVSHWTRFRSPVQALFGERGIERDGGLGRCSGERPESGWSGGASRWKKWGAIKGMAHRILQWPHTQLLRCSKVRASCFKSNLLLLLLGIIYVSSLIELLV